MSVDILAEGHIHMHTQRHAHMVDAFCGEGLGRVRVREARKRVSVYVCGGRMRGAALCCTDGTPVVCCRMDGQRCGGLPIRGMWM